MIVGNCMVVWHGLRLWTTVVHSKRVLCMVLWIIGTLCMLRAKTQLLE